MKKLGISDGDGVEGGRGRGEKGGEKGRGSGEGEEAEEGGEGGVVGSFDALVFFCFVLLESCFQSEKKKEKTQTSIEIKFTCPHEEKLLNKPFNSNTPGSLPHPKFSFVVSKTKVLSLTLRFNSFSLKLEKREVREGAERSDWWACWCQKEKRRTRRGRWGKKIWVLYPAGSNY